MDTRWEAEHFMLFSCFSGYKQTVLIPILSNISRRKSNQTMKFDQLIECNMKIIFLEKSFAKWDAETSPRLFYEKLKLRISLVV